MQAAPLETQLNQIDMSTFELMKIFAKLSKMIEESPNRRDLEKTLMGVTEERKLSDDDESEIASKADHMFQLVEKFNLKRKEEKEDAAEESKLNTSRDSYDRQQRGYVDGCFDLMHAGHFNAIRQASYLTPWLVVGPNSDEEIMRFKGPTVLSSEERQSICRAIKWTDEVEKDGPYIVSEELLDKLNCQFYVHGDDPVMNENGQDIC